MHPNRRRVYGMFSVLALGLILVQTALGADKDLKGRWKFDEGAGTTVGDSSGNGNVGTIVSGPTWTTDAKRGGAMQFSANGYVDCGTGSSLAIGDAVSMAAWIKVNVVAADHKVGGNQDNSHGGYKMSVYSNNKVEFEIRTSSNGAVLNRDTGGGTTFQTGVWYHVTGVYSHADGYIRTYVNGVLDREMATAEVLGVSPGPFRIGCEPFTPTGNLFNGIMDDVRVYSRALTAEELLVIMAGLDNAGVASDPAPKAGASDVPRDVVLGWKPGEFAKTHDVYFGTLFDDVNTASLGAPLGLLASQGQGAAAFDPAGLLAYGQTYYWRVDEVNSPDKPATYKGDTWNFTVEPYGYPVKPLKATASSSMAPTMGPDKTIDGSGLDNLDQHGISASQMWLSKKGVTPIWIQYEFDTVYKLWEMWVWNSNQGVELDIGFGAKDVTIETSLDGTTWTAVPGVSEFNQATGDANYVHNTTVNFGGVQAKFVKVTISDNWADSPKQAGLAEVRFFYVPVKAFQPAPANGAGDVALSATLNWRPGREAATHQLTLGADANAVTNGTVAAITLTEHSLPLASLGLDYGKTYYWKVTEVNDATTPKVQEGDMWSFTATAYRVVDDFESYDDLCMRIFFGWVDGFGHGGSADCGVAPNPGNATGSTVGNINTPFAEQTIRHGGRQSMPLGYDNTKSARSEAERTFATPQDWTGNGLKSLSLWFYGTAGNSGQLYVKIDNAKVVYDGEATDIGRPMWQPWNIALSTINGADLKGVRKLVIGVEGGATGKLTIDDIRLYPKAPEFITPVTPSNTGLAARYTFDGNVNDSSGKGFNGTVNGAVAYETGLFGQAIVLNGTDSVVVVNSVGIAAGATRTLSGWAKARQTNIPAWTNVFGFTGSSSNNQFFDIEAVGDTGSTTLGWYGLHRYGWERNIMPIDQEWHHLAATYDGTTVAWYGDGKFVGSGAVTTADLAATGTVRMGNRGENTNYFPGSLDEIRIYNRALSEAEIGGLAGRTKPMHKPF